MIDLLTAIQTKWNTTSALTDLLPVYHLGMPPANSPKPYARLMSLAGTTDYETTNGVSQPAFEDSIYQFDVFTDSSVADSDLWNANAIKAIDKAFNLKPLSLSYDYFLSSRRIGKLQLLRESETTWHGFVTFKFKTVSQV